MKSPKKYSTSSNLDFRIQNTEFRIQNYRIKLSKKSPLSSWIYFRIQSIKKLMAKPPKQTSLEGGRDLPPYSIPSLKLLASSNAELRPNGFFGYFFVHKQKSNNLEVISKGFEMFVDIKLSDAATRGPHPRSLSIWRRMT